MNTDSPENTKAQPLLAVKDLKKYFPIHKEFLKRHAAEVRAVDGVSFQIYDNETLGLVGESGCGKSTLARCIVRAHQPTSGQSLFRTRQGDSIDLATLSQRELRPIRRDIQMVFQNPFTSLNARMTLLDIVGEPLLVHGVKSRKDRTDRVVELLRLVGLRPEYLRRFPHAFSGGQRQRIGIARALALNPRLIVADEPVSSLDASIQAQVLNLLMDLRQQLGLSYLFISHDLRTIRHICDRVAVMYLGKIVEMGQTDDLFRSPKHPYTSALLSAVLNMDPRLRGRHTLLEGEVPSLAAPPNGCRFHPRCRHAIDKCRTDVPAELVTPQRLTACHRAEELKLGGIT